MRDGYGAEWVRYDLMGYWRPWFVKSNTVLIGLNKRVFV